MTASLPAPRRPVVALAGNPNTGKSTVYNALTGLRQHTGNWPGKTVARSEGLCRRAGLEMRLVDLPGTYSLLASSPEEVVARDFICFGRPDATVVVVDATCLERNLNLVLQVLEITPKVVVCLNLVDEARRAGTGIDPHRLERELGVPVVPTVARDGDGLDHLVETAFAVATGRIRPEPPRMVYAAALEAQACRLEGLLEPWLDGRVNRRWVALRLIEGDTSILESAIAAGAATPDTPERSPEDARTV